jgi:ELWxxDGT repeat protein
MRNIVLLFIFFFASIVSFGQFSLLKDINQTEAGSNPQNFVEANGFVFFTVQTNDGYELWQTDGTEGGTKRTTELLIIEVKRLTGDEPYVFENELYFVANINNYENFQLMKTDGFTVETVLENMPTVRFYFFNGKPHYFSGGGLLAVENGTSVFVKRNLPADISNEQVPQVVGDKLIFFLRKRNAITYEFDLEVWQSDGTEIGTSKVKEISEIPSGYSSGDPTYDKESITIGNECFFVVNRFNETQVELWKTDGSETGTKLVKIMDNSNPYSNGRPIAEHMRPYKNGVVFISKYTDLWFSDGTENGTVKLHESFFQTNFQPKFWGELNGKLYFGTSSSSNSSLWETDGTVAGTKQIKSFSLPQFALPNQFSTYNGVLYFVANYNQLWKSDGTEAGTKFVLDIPKPGTSLDNERIFPSLIITSSNKILFSNYEPQTGYELWISEGTAVSTRLLKNIVTTTASSAGSRNQKIRAGNLIYFDATDGINGRELWKSDGTAEGTIMVKDITAGEKSTVINEMSALESLVYFTAYSNLDFNNSTVKLYKTDGTETGTVELPFSDGSSEIFTPQKLVTADQKIYFNGISQNSGYSLWVATNLSPNPVRIQPTGGIINRLADYATIGDRLIFRNSQLWVSDGTNESTKPVLSGMFPNFPRSPQYLINFKGKVYFMSYYFDNANDFKVGLYATDGTEAGTNLIKSFDNGGDYINSYINFLQKSDDRLFFSMNFRSDSFDLWTSDGSTSGTEFVKQVQVSFASQNFKYSSVGDKFYLFNCGDYSENYKLTLWVSDGTSDGTIQLLNDNGNIFPFISTASFNDKLYFNKYDPKYGYELWSTDGTVNGTYLVKDVRPGNKNTITGNILSLGEKLIFWAIDSQLNTEPWTYTSTQCRVACLPIAIKKIR